MKIIDINKNTRECKSVSPDPDFPGFMRILYESKNRKGYIHAEWYPIADFVKNNPNLTGLTKGLPKTAKEDLGVVTAAEEKTLVDSHKDWQKNIFASTTIWISRGKGEGQTREILANTDKIITVDRLWDTIPDKTSQYVISANIHDPQVLGNTLGETSPKKIKDAKLEVDIDYENLSN